MALKEFASGLLCLQVRLAFVNATIAARVATQLDAIEKLDLQ